MTSEPLQKAAVLASLIETYTDSEDELEGAADERKEPISIAMSPSGRPLVSYRADEDDEEDDEGSKKSGSGLRPRSPVSFHRALQKLGPDDAVPLPPEPRGRCAPALQEKIARLYQRKLRDRCDMNASIQMRKDFRNPSIYEKLIAYCGIDELGTNYPPETFDPQKWGPESYYEELSRRQKEEMDKRDRTGTSKKKPDSRKTKWDAVQPLLGFAGVAAAPSTKPAVISAFGALPKKNSSKH